MKSTATPAKRGRPPSKKPTLIIRSHEPATREELQHMEVELMPRRISKLSRQKMVRLFRVD